MKLDLNKLFSQYSVRVLEKQDIDMTYELCSKNELFYQYHPPFVTKESILEDMQALPPGKTEKDKYYIGYFDDNTLVAVLDLILGYPNEKTAYIGFFMMNTVYQRKGIA